MKQQLINEAEHTSPVAEPLEILNDAERSMLLHEGLVTPEEQRNVVLAALKKREMQQKTATELFRIIQWLIAAFSVAVVLGMISVVYIFHLRQQIRDLQSAANRKPTSVETLNGSILSPPDAAKIGGPLKLVKASTLKKGHTAYADLETVTALAKGRRPSETFVSLTMPAVNPVSIGATVIGNEPFWQMVKAERGYNLIVYASAGDALAAANGEYAVVYARPIRGGVETPIPFQKLPPYDGILSETTDDNMSIALPDPDPARLP